MPSQLINRRLARRLLIHHAPIAMVCVASAILLYITRPYRDVITRLSFATAYPALGLLSATLLIGPWNLLRARPSLVSNDLRRDLGIWAGIVGVAHSAIVQCVHLRGRPWLYYVYGSQDHSHSFPIRHDLFGLANYSGLFSVLLLAALFATSNDLSLRALGTRRWKQLQQWNYVVFALTAIHAFAFQAVEKQKISFVVVVGFFAGVTLAVQMAGFLMRRAAGRSLNVA